MKQRVLFLCTHNSARSQMAEGLLRRLAGDRFEVASAGTEKTRVRPEAIEALRKRGIDISAQTSKTVEKFITQEWDYVITLCDQARESCPHFPRAGTRLHWSFAEPSTAVGMQPQEAFDRIAGQIEERLARWVDRVIAKSRPFVPVMASVPEREQMREQTLAELAAAGIENVRVFEREDTGPRNHATGREDGIRVLAWALHVAPDAPILFLEDDIAVDPTLGERMSRFLALDAVVTLYLPTALPNGSRLHMYPEAIKHMVEAGVRFLPECVFPIFHPDMWGSQAVLIPSDVAEAIVRRRPDDQWWTGPDVAIFQEARRTSVLYGICPDLVQHRPAPSVVGTGSGLHRSATFGWNWAE